MVGVLDIFSGRSAATGLVSVAQMAARPQFELQFATLQNTLITRINKQIDAVNADKSNNVDAFKVLEKTRLSRLEEYLSKYRGEIVGAFNALENIHDNLEGAHAAVDAAEAGSPESLNALLGKINQVAELMKPINGIPVGEVIDDGMAKTKREGVVTVQRNGETVKVTDYADFIDATEARTAITAAISKIDASILIISTKAEAAYTQHESVKQQLLTVRLDIEAQKTTDSAEKTAKVTKLEQEYANLLNTLSVVFEGRQAVVDHFARSLFMPPEFDKGSVINMFT